MGLGASWSASGEEPSTLANRLAIASEAQAKGRKQFSEEMARNPTAEAQRPIVERYQKAIQERAEEMLALAVAHPKDPAIVPALQFVITTARAGPGDESYRAMELLRAHVKEPGMGELCGRIFYFIHVPIAEELIRAVLKEHPNRIDRGLACHTLATYLQLQARMVRRVREKPARIDEYVHERHKEATERLVKQADPDALDREVETLLERVVAEFADVPDWYDKRPLGRVAEGELFAARNLSIGKVAPEIQGKDHEGRPFALGSYRGKVVVLTFSGNWCGPCVGMYPQERQLLARLMDRPFALVSVNTDADVKTLKKSITDGEITWRCWWDGGTAGPITSRWGIQAFPSIFVLDPAGVIRFKDVRGDDLEKAVDSLLKEAAAAGESRPS
jgi:peroxiredoxin